MNTDTLDLAGPDRKRKPLRMEGPPCPSIPEALAEALHRVGSYIDVPDLALEDCDEVDYDSQTVNGVTTVVCTLTV